MIDYAEYERLFNAGDDEALMERFFSDDVVFLASSRVARGKAELRTFLEYAHDGVMERMRPQKVVNEGDFIFVEVDMDFHATKERPDFPFGHMHPGDTVTVKFFVTYRLENDKIVELKSMTWPPNKDVTTMPRLGAHPSQQGAYLAYVSAFSNADYARFSAFYQDDVVLELGSVPTIHGKQGIVDFYAKMFPVVRENVTVHSLDFTDDAIVLEAVSRFTATVDAPDFVVGALEQGEAIEVPVGVRYDLKDGLVQKITVRRRGAPTKIGL